MNMWTITSKRQCCPVLYRADRVLGRERGERLDDRTRRRKHYPWADDAPGDRCVHIVGCVRGASTLPSPQPEPS